MIFALLGLIIGISPFIAIALLISYMVRRSGGDAGRALRRLFRYGMLLVLMILVGTGLSGLAAVADPDVVGGPGFTAFMLACVIIAGPGLVLVARWVARSLRSSGGDDPGWEIYLVVAELLSLGVATTGAYLWAVGLIDGRFRITPAALMVVWGAVWFIHYVLAGRRDRARYVRYGILLGSLGGLVTGAGFGILFLEALLGRIYSLLMSTTVVSGGPDPIFGGLIGLTIWGAVWLFYWVFLGLRTERTVWWRACVLLVGVVGGLTVTLNGVWGLAYRILDWFFGDSSDPARLHFEELPIALALVVVGGLVWRYHRNVLQGAGPVSRSEVDRVHEYTVSGVGLVATVGGLVAVIAASVGAMVPGDLVDGSDRSYLVAAVTVLLVGAPLWWRYWIAAQGVRQADPDPELHSPTRRIYLICVFGAGAVVALVSLFTLAYRILESLLEGDFGTGTIFDVRWSLALVLTVGVVAAYHRAVRRVDLSDQPPEELPAGVVQTVVLVGSGGGEVASSVEAQTGAKVQVWERTDADVSLSVETVVDAIESAEHEHLLIVALPDGHEVIPYTR